MEKSRWTLTTFDLSPEQRSLCPSFHASCPATEGLLQWGEGVSRGGGASGAIRCAVSASLRLLPAWVRSPSLLPPPLQPPTPLWP